MRRKELRLVITFPTTADAIAAEKTFREHGVPGRSVPVPRALSASCGISWCMDPGDRKQAEEVIRAFGLQTEGMHECMLYV